MKTFTINIIALMMLMGVMSTLAFAQTIAVPPKVQIAFAAKYPQTQLKNWKIEDGQYVASFVMDNRDGEVTYDRDGNWVSTMTIYRHVFKHLTPVMRDELRNSVYASYHLDQVKTLQMPNMDMLLFTLGNDNGNISAYENTGPVDMETVYFNHSEHLIKSVDNH